MISRTVPADLQRTLDPSSWKQKILLKYKKMNIEFTHCYRIDISMARKHYPIVYALCNYAKSFFKQKSYSQMVDNLDIELVCVQPGGHIKLFRPQYVEDKQQKYFPRQKDSDTFRIYHELYVDVLLPEEYIDSDAKESVEIIRDTTIDYFTNVALPVKIRKTFDKEAFVVDLRQFFDTFIEQRGWEQEGKKEANSNEFYRTVHEPDGTIKIERVKDGVATVVFIKNKDGGFEIL